MAMHTNLFDILPVKKQDFIEPNALNDALKSHPDIGMDSIQLYVDTVARARRAVIADPDDIEWFKCYRDTVKEIYKKAGVSAPTSTNVKVDPADNIPIEKLRDWQANLATRAALSTKPIEPTPITPRSDDVSPK